MQGSEFSIAIKADRYGKYSVDLVTYLDGKETERREITRGRARASAFKEAHDTVDRIHQELARSRFHFIVAERPHAGEGEME